MDQRKTGQLIRTLRLRKGLTQHELGDRLHISDRTVSKWERGCGAPDVALLPVLAAFLGTDTDTLLRGEWEDTSMSKNDMRSTRFYVCPRCGKIAFSQEETRISCCGQHLTAQEAGEPDAEHAITANESDGDWYITLAHEMTREHYISFAALVSDDTVVLKKLYPQWGAELRMPRYAHGQLFWYCTEHGLFSAEI